MYCQRSFALVFVVHLGSWADGFDGAVAAWKAAWTAHVTGKANLKQINWFLTGLPDLFKEICPIFCGHSVAFLLPELFSVSLLLLHPPSRMPIVL